MSRIRTHIAEIPQKIGETITVKGHAQTIREQSSIAFIVLREITGTIYAGVLTHMLRNGVAFYYLYVIGAS